MFGVSRSDPEALKAEWHEVARLILDARSRNALAAVAVLERRSDDLLDLLNAIPRQREG